MIFPRNFFKDGDFCDKKCVLASIGTDCKQEESTSIVTAGRSLKINRVAKLNSIRFFMKGVYLIKNCGRYFKNSILKPKLGAFENRCHIRIAKN